MAGLYIHIPYCHAKCAYCDFYSTPRSETAEAYVDALVEEYRMRLPELGGEPVRTIYIGGGTPSSLPLPTLMRLIGKIDKEDVEEFTVEVNPEDVSATLLDQLKEAGVNRISMGVQSLQDDELQRVGRRHSAEYALRAIDLIAGRFDNYSLDLIYGLPGQTMESLEHTVERLLSFRPPHLSAYLLSYEPGTRLYAQLVAGRVEEASEEVAEAMYALVAARLSEHGYEHYEISNYALPGRYSRHNSSYWNLTPYLGIGVSAHSFAGSVRRYNPTDIRAYINTINQGKSCYIIDDETERERFNDHIIVALRTSRGFDMESLGRYSPSLAEEFSRQLVRVLKDGRVERRGSSIIIPPHRWLTADSVMRDLIL